jgi:hypothetical protein
VPGAIRSARALNEGVYGKQVIHNDRERSELGVVRKEWDDWLSSTSDIDNGPGAADEGR